jgi:hypothetical protein
MSLSPVFHEALAASVLATTRSLEASFVGKEASRTLPCIFSISSKVLDQDRLGGNTPGKRTGF